MHGRRAPSRRTVRRRRRCWPVPASAGRRTRPSRAPSATAGQSMPPSNGTRCSSLRPRLSCTWVVRRWPDSVSTASTGRPSGRRARSPGRRRRRGSSSSSSRMRTRASGVDSAFGITSSASARRAGPPAPRCSSRLRHAASRLLSPAAAGSASGTPRCTTRKPTGTRRAMASAALVSCSARSPRPAVARRVGEGRAPAPVDVALRERRVDRVQTQPRSRQPRLERRDGSRVVIVEMRAGRDELDRVEAVGRDLLEMVAREPLAVIELRRDPEPHWFAPCQLPKHLL